MGGNAHPCR